MSFLSKKSWHARSTKNVAKVWQAEKEHQEEQDKIAQRLKELQEEHEIEALRKIHARTTGTELKEQRIEWMYKEPTPISQLKEDSDAYLMGKRLEERREDNVVRKVQESAGSLFVQASVSGASDLDIRAKMRDDPLYIMKKRESEYIKHMNTATQAIHSLRQKKELDQKVTEGEERKKDRYYHDDGYRSYRRKKYGGDDDDDEWSRKRMKERYDQKPNGDYGNGRFESNDRDWLYQNDSRYSKRTVDQPLNTRNQRTFKKYRSEHRNDLMSSSHRRASGIGSYDDSGDYRSDHNSQKREEKMERARLLEEMQKNAREVNESRVEMIERMKQHNIEEEREMAKRDPSQQLQPQFISKIGQSVFKDTKTGSLEERLASRSFYIQKDTNGKWASQ